MIANLAALARDVAAALSLPLGMIVYQKDHGDPIAFDLTGEQPPTRLPKKIRNNP